MKDELTEHHEIQGRVKWGRWALYGLSVVAATVALAFLVRASRG